MGGRLPRLRPAHHPPLKSGEPPLWNPALFALDLLLPVIDLGQAGFWQLHDGWQWLSTAPVLLGWVLATTVAAGATRPSAPHLGRAGAVP
ncbi:hypothetical protein SCYAM73S_03924 [Streptomyces cyaneofuscatus]